MAEKKKRVEVDPTNPPPPDAWLDSIPRDPEGQVVPLPPEKPPERKPDKAPTKDGDWNWAAAGGAAPPPPPKKEEESDVAATVFDVMRPSAAARKVAKGWFGVDPEGDKLAKLKAEEAAKEKAKADSLVSNEAARTFDQMAAQMTPAQMEQAYKQNPAMLEAWAKRNPEAAQKLAATIGASSAPRGGGSGGGIAPPRPQMRTDGQGNLLPGLVRVGMSQSVQGQVPLPKEVYDLYGGAAEHALGGAVSEAQAAKQEAQAKAEGAAQASAVHQQMAQRRMQAEDRRLDEVDGIMMDMEDTLEKMRNSKIDPEAWMASKSGFGKVMTAIGLAMTTWSAAVNHTENVGLKMIQQGIQNSIDAQKANFEILGRQMGEQRNLYAAMLQKHGDERSAEAATEAALLNVVKLEFEKKLAIAQDPRIRANLEGGIARVQEALANKMVELAKLQYGQRSRGEQFSLPKPRGGGGGAPRKRKPPRWVAEQLKSIIPAKSSADVAIQKMKIWSASHPDGGEFMGLSPFGAVAVDGYMKGGALGRKAYVKAFGADSEAVLRSLIDTVQRERNAVTGAHFSDAEAAEFAAKRFGAGGDKSVMEGLLDMKRGLDAQVGNVVGGDPEAYGDYLEGQGEYGLDKQSPTRSPVALPTE